MKTGSGPEVMWEIIIYFFEWSHLFVASRSFVSDFFCIFDETV